MITNLKLNNLTNKVTIIDKKQLILENNFNKLLSEYKNKLLRIETNIIKLNNKCYTYYKQHQKEEDILNLYF